MSEFIYRGVAGNGAGVYGRLPGDWELATWVQQRFRRRYRELTVTFEGREVAGISTNPLSGQRTWWAEAGSVAQAGVREGRRPGALTGRRCSCGAETRWDEAGMDSFCSACGTYPAVEVRS